jgi:hypothetical protein
MLLSASAAVQHPFDEFPFTVTIADASGSPGGRTGQEIRIVGI